MPVVLFGDHSCAVKYIETPFFRGADGTVLLKNNSDFISKYYYYLIEYLVSEFISCDKYERHFKYLKNLYIPIPPKDIQQSIVDEIYSIEKDMLSCQKDIKQLQNNILDICTDTINTQNTCKLKTMALFNPPKSEINTLCPDSIVSFVDMPSVSNNGKIDVKKERVYRDVRKGGYTYFAENDIIIAKITPCMENGKCAIATNLSNGIAFGSSEFHVIRPSDNLDVKFLFTLLNRADVRIQAEKVMTGSSGHKRVPISFYEEMMIPIISLDEQRKIVAKIEKLEAEIAKAQNVIDKAPEQKQAILKKYL